MLVNVAWNIYGRDSYSAFDLSLMNFTLFTSDLSSIGQFVPTTNSVLRQIDIDTERVIYNNTSFDGRLGYDVPESSCAYS